MEDLGFRITLLSPEKNQTKFSELVVVIVGWIGSSFKYISKYAQWYSKQGIHTVSTTPPGILRN